MENLSWPKNFMDIGGLLFSDVYKKKTEFVDFTLTEMKKPTGLLKKWQDYCKWRIKSESPEK